MKDLAVSIAGDVARVAKPFYSRMQRSIEKKMPNAASADQVLAIVRDPQNAHSDEVKWSGIEDWLKEKDGKVSKQEVMQFLEANNIQVTEDPKSEYDVNVAGATKYQKYTLPGGKHYRELLLTWGNKPPKPIGDERIVVRMKMPTLGWHDNEVYGRDAAQRWVDTAKKYGWEHEVINKGRQTVPDPYTSGHWNEPNILAHVRFNERTDAAGKKTLFIEEVQSDWHQAGREKGYKGTESAKEAEARAQAANAAIDAQVRDLRREMAAETGTDPTSARLRENIQQQIDILGEMRERESREAGVPDAPFKKNWHELAMKRMLRWAAENGYDKVAWTTGDQQAKRYGKLMEGIKWLKYDPEDGKLKYFHNRAINTHKDLVKPEDLPGVVGKENAKRLLESPKDQNGHHFMEGPLTISSEGMKGFYDKMLVDFMNRYGKKWGAQVGETEVPVKRSRVSIEGGPDFLWTIYQGEDPIAGYTTQTAAREHLERLGPGYTLQRPNLSPAGNEKVHSIPVTPAMKKSVMEEGQPIARATTPPPIRQTAQPPGALALA